MRLVGRVRRARRSNRTASDCSHCDHRSCRAPVRRRLRPDVHVAARSMDRESLAEPPTIEIYRAALPPGGVPDKQDGVASGLHDSIRASGSLSEGGPHRISRSAHAGRLQPSCRIIGSVQGSNQGRENASSADSNIVTARIYPAPDAPRDVHVDVTETAMVVTWAETASPPGATSRSYRVYRGALESDQSCRTPHKRS